MPADALDEVPDITETVRAAWGQHAPHQPITDVDPDLEWITVADGDTRLRVPVLIGDQVEFGTPEPAGDVAATSRQQEVTVPNPNPQVIHAAARVTVDDVRTAFYQQAASPRQWIRELSTHPQELIVADDGSGAVVRVGYEIDDDGSIRFTPPKRVRVQYVEDDEPERVAASRMVYASAAESRPELVLAADDRGPDDEDEDEDGDQDLPEGEGLDGDPDGGDGDGEDGEDEDGEEDEEPEEVAAAEVSDRPWSDFTQADYTPEQWRRACLIDKGPDHGDEDTKARYALPVREPDGTLNRNGVHAAAARINQVEGISDEQRRTAARTLVRLYGQIGDEPPESLLELAGMQAAAEVVAHLPGKHDQSSHGRKKKSINVPSLGDGGGGSRRSSGSRSSRTSRSSRSRTSTSRSTTTDGGDTGTGTRSRSSRSTSSRSTSTRSRSSSGGGGRTRSTTSRRSRSSGGEQAPDTTRQRQEQPTNQRRDEDLPSRVYRPELAGRPEQDLRILERIEDTLQATQGNSVATGIGVPIAYLREQFPDMDQAEFDAALRRLALPGPNDRLRPVHLLAASDQKLLTDRDRRNAISFGNEERHFAGLDPQALPPRTGRTSQSQTPGQWDTLVDWMRNTSSPNQAFLGLRGLSTEELREVANAAGVSVPDGISQEDLRELVAREARQSRRVSASHDPHRQTPAAEPGNPYLEEEIMPLSTEVYQRLGLDVDADPDEVNAAILEALDRADDKQVAASAMPEGVVAIEASVLDELRQKAELGAQAAERQRVEDRDKTIEAAIADGRIAPARRDHWTKLWEADPDGTRQVLASLEPGLIVPVEPKGTVGDPTKVDAAADDEDEPEWLFSKVPAVVGGES